VARFPAYSLIWLSERRCSGPVCSRTAHLGKPDQLEGCTAVPPKTSHWAGTQSDMKTMCIVAGLA